MTIEKPAITDSPLHPLIAQRWSPRLYDSDHELSEAELAALGEAFRWAPSSNNQQPWQVVFLTRGSETFNAVAERGLTGFNQSWAPSASAFAVVLAAKTHEGKDREQAGTYFDVGLASSQLVMQAQSMGLYSHFMGGIIPDEISRIIGDESHWVVCVITVGVQGELESAEPAIQDRERTPRARKSSGEVYKINP